MKSNLELFILIKNHKWDEFVNMLSDLTDYNIQDENNNYLIQYIILYNKVDVLEKLLKYNIKLDILDNEGRSILYTCIKYNYLDIIKLLVKKNSVSIGISIVNLADRYSNYPLHYALIFKNFKIFEYLVDISSNLYVFDKNKNSLYTYIIKFTNNVIFIEKFLSKNININIFNAYLETPLHLAFIYNKKDYINLILEKKPNINLKTNYEKVTPIMLACYNNYIDNFKTMLYLDPDLNLQEQEGNTCLHIAIERNNFEIINIIINQKNINYNLCNIHGLTPLHLIFNKVSNNINIKNYNIKKFIKKTNLNIQDNNGDTCWHFIVKLKIYSRYSKILKNKNNNVFILNKKNITPYNLCVDQDSKNLLKIIKISFYNNLNKKKKWIIKWQSKCSKKKLNRNKCISLIKKYILKNKISIPISKKKYNIEIKLYEKIKHTYFTGITLDIITSYIYILEKYSFLMSSISINYITNKEIINFYKKNSLIKNLYTEYFNFEILWCFYKLFFPSNLNERLLDFINNNDKLIFFIPIGIVLEISGHANIIIIDKNFKIIERFEPNGSEEPHNYYYNHSLLDYFLKIYFEKIFPSYIYLTPNDYLPIISLQTLESYESHEHKRIGDPGGFCVVWCVWYLEQRVLYKIHPKKLILELINNIKIKNLSFKKLIRSFSNNILIIRDTLLTNLNIDINDIINNNIKYNDILKINAILDNKINSIE